MPTGEHTHELHKRRACLTPRKRTPLITSSLSASLSLSLIGHSSLSHVFLSRAGLSLPPTPSRGSHSQPLLSHLSHAPQDGAARHKTNISPCPVSLSQSLFPSFVAQTETQTDTHICDFSHRQKGHEKAQSTQIKVLGSAAAPAARFPRRDKTSQSAHTRPPRSVCAILLGESFVFTWRPSPWSHR